MAKPCTHSNVLRKGKKAKDWFWVCRDCDETFKSITNYNKVLYLNAENFTLGYNKGYEEGIKDAIAKLPPTKIEFRLPPDCGFICHLCVPSLAMSLEEREAHMREVHHAQKW